MAADVAHEGPTKPVIIQLTWLYTVERRRQETISRHGNGAGGVRVLSPQSLIPTPQHIPIPVPDTRRVKVYYPIPVPIEYPSGIGYP